MDGVGAACTGACRSPEDGRYQALPPAGAEGGSGGGRALILDTREGHVWVWSENELMAKPGGGRRNGPGFTYQGKLRPGGAPGETIDPRRSGSRAARRARTRLFFRRRRRHLACAAQGGAFLSRYLLIPHSP
ncbi:hypothetical protein [Thiobacillus sp.]